jgi:uncharacterized Zn finger protein
MAKQKAIKESPEKETSEITFTCKFCGESKSLDEMILETRFFPILVSCRECGRTLQSLKMEEPAIVIENEENSDSEERIEEETGSD